MTREEIIQKAREIYIVGGVTNNISEALHLYIKNDATEEEKIPMFIETPEIARLEALLQIDRPKCECGADLHFHSQPIWFNGKVYQTAWDCLTCNKIEFSDMSVKEWLEAISEDRK